jgi:hypothetical protein
MMNADDYQLTENTIREWAYDPAAELADVDEDLELQQPQHVELLLVLAGDPSCPKRDYILSILDHYMMNLVLRGTVQDLLTVRRTIERAGQLHGQDIRDWAEAQERRLAYRDGVGPLNQAAALSVAHELLNGVCRSANLSISGETTDAWQIDLSVPPNNRAIERLLLDKETGRFRYLANHTGMEWREYGPKFKS